MLPKRFDGLRLRLHVGWLAQHAFFIQAGAVLAVAQGAVGAGGGVPQIFAFWQYAQRIGTLKQGDVATVLKHGGVLVAVQQNQILGDEFGIYHAARAVLEVELPVSHLVGAAYALAHGDDFLLERGRIALRGDDGAAYGIKPCAQARAAKAAAGAGHGLVLPKPCGVAAALELVALVRFYGGGKQARVAVGAQGGVDFVEVAFAGFAGEPSDEFAHQHGVDFARALVGVFVDKDQIQIAAIANLP